MCFCLFQPFSLDSSLSYRHTLLFQLRVLLFENPVSVLLVLPVWSWVEERVQKHEYPLRAHIPEENWISISQGPSLTNSSSARCGSPCVLFCLCWDFDRLDLLQVFHLQPQSQFLYVMVLSHTKMLFHFRCSPPLFLQSFHSLFHDGPSVLWGGNVIQLSHLELATPQSVFSLYVGTSCGLFHLL